MSPDDQKVTRGDIEAKLREIRGDVDQTAEQAKPVGLVVAVGGVLLLVVVAYALGRRKGKKKTTLVEIRRV